MTRIIAATACIILLLGSLTLADSPARADNQKNSNVNPTRQRLDQISECVQFWHDAVLAGDNKTADHFKNRLFGLLENDITMTREKNVATNLQRTKPEYGPNEDRNKAMLARSLQEASAAQQKRDVVMAKQRLYASMQRTDAFSNQYRLAEDYMQIMKDELGRKPVQVAEKPQSDSGK